MRLGLLELLAVFFELRLDRLQPQRVLAGGGLVAGAQMRGRLGAQVLLLGFELAHLAHDALAQAGMRGQSLVEVRDLLAQVFLLQLEQRLRIALLDAGDEEREEAFEEIPESAEHAPSAGRSHRSLSLIQRGAERSENRRCESREKACEVRPRRR